MADNPNPPAGGPLANGDSSNKAPQSASGSSQPPKPAAQADGAPALTPAQLKKQKQAEKAARRAKEKADKDTGGARPSGPTGPAGSTTKKGEAQKEGKQPPKDHRAGGPQGGQQSKGQQRHQESGSTLQKNIPVRGKPSAISISKESKKEKEVGLFGHLYGQPRRHTIENAAKEVHPAILALGLQMSSYVVCGSTARCVAMLLAFKSVIESYTTPPGTSLARHLTSHHLVSFYSSLIQ
jgi:translation initiation factor eIF-2B subunit delta